MSFRPSDVLKKNLSSSSRSWLVRQARDPYVKQRLASATSYRSRSAFKLLEIDKNWGRFLSRNEICAVVDLGAAPGGWSQVVAEKLGWINPAISTVGRGVIVAVDLLHIAPIPGVHTLQMDFLSSQAAGAVKNALSAPENPSGMADIILSDMAANFSGNRVRDVEMSLDICHSVFQFAKDNLHVAAAASAGTKKQRGGTLLLKHFEHPLSREFREKYLDPNFNSVNYIKPSASRTGSAEGYWLCRGWKGLQSH
ncbi:hypothetical protein M404DRAFT_152381 [Pisolithus tinctorius Marx 270]|uniref:rRNA methyltransferase 2, mitochondrial n=1 Tax=Pisolithus tinctorius Marx 270 TaxID=870435 RepID=A0A0C3NI48_PISTI|nr:hypothetical protein M404DRAFT_152381 [Pisolithus tinctorius Marx 270]